MGPDAPWSKALIAVLLLAVVPEIAVDRLTDEPGDGAIVLPRPALELLTLLAGDLRGDDDLGFGHC
jgi:hypothetical protein